MQKRLSSVLCLLVTAPLAAQLQYTAGLVSATELRAQTTGIGGNTRTVPANTDLSAGRTLSSTSSLAAATTTVTFLHSGTGPTVVTIQESCTAAFVPTQPAGASTGPHSTRFTLRSSNQSGGRLRVSFTTDRIGGSTAGSSSVDIGANGSVEFTAQRGQNFAQDFFVAIDSIGLPILTTTGVGAGAIGASATIGTTLVLRFEPATACATTRYGPGCGPTLSLSERFVGATKDVTFRITGAPPLALGVEAIGLVRANLPIPGTNCVLLTQPVVTLSFGIDFNGSGEITHSVPYDLPFTLDVQDVAVQSGGGSIVLITSDALEVVCR